MTAGRTPPGPGQHVGMSLGGLRIPEVGDGRRLARTLRQRVKMHRVKIAAAATPQRGRGADGGRGGIKARIADRQ